MDYFSIQHQDGVRGGQRDPPLLIVTDRHRPMARWLGGYPYTHFVTMTPQAADYGGWRAPADNYGLKLRQTTDVFLRRLSKDLYGRGANKRDISAAVFFENRTKTGDPTYWHAHALIQIADDYCDDRLHQKATGSWRRLIGDGGSIDILRICASHGGVIGVADYITKNDNNGTVEPLFYSTMPSSYRPEPH